MKNFTLLLFFALLVGVSNSSAQSPIFTEGYAAGVTFSTFGGAINNLTEDATTAYTGTRSLKIEVPTGSYTGGALVAATPQDLSTYNAVSFWVKASAAKTLNVSGLGNNAIVSTYQVELKNVAVTTTWTKVIIPIPNPAKYTNVTGLFHFAEGSDEGAYTIWMDDIQYETTTVGTATATINAQMFTRTIGETFTPNSNGTCAFTGIPATIFDINSVYFTYASANPAIATMNGATGVGTAVAAGSTTITAMLGAVTATGGPISVTVTAAPTGPIVAAPTPTRPAADVISVFSNAYTDLAGTDFFPNWNQTTVVTDVMIAGNATKKYANFNYEGTQFASPINASTMQFLHIDYWSSTMNSFDINLVNIPPLAQTEQKVTVTPTLSGWNSLDIPLSSYTAINLSAIGQFKLEGRPSGGDAFIDNIYFYKSAIVPPTVPTVAATTPTRGAANVISLFSGAYTDVAGTDWNPGWGQSTAYSEVAIATNPTKKYETMNYQGIALASSVNVSTMEFLHLDLWTPNCTAFNVFLINPGPVEQSVTLTPTLSGWNSFDIPLSSYNTINLTNVFQLKLVSTPFGTGTAYVDNVYFYKVPPTTPTIAATAPTLPAVNTISLFSDTYTNRDMGWNKYGTGPTYEVVSIAGNNIQKYTGLGFTIAEPAVPINTGNATHMHLDVWTPNAIAAGAFKVKLVDYGADGTGFGPADNSEGEVLNLPAIPAATWVALDIPLADFAAATPALGSTEHIAQLIPSGGGTVFMDNIYFYAAVALPVELTNFSAKAVNNTTLLSWSTATEKDNQGFTIERSTNATNFTTIGEVKGNGTTSTVSNYTFTDATPSNGVNYYRLRQVDFNGKETVSKTASVVFSKGGLFIKNTLVHDVLDVTVSDASKGPLSIFNVSGQLVYSTTVSGNQQINLSALTAGLYIVRTSTGEVSRFVKD